MTQKLCYTKWLVMSPNVFVDHINEYTILLYDTKTGVNKVCHDKNLIELIKLLYSPYNLGVIKYEHLKEYDSEDVEWALKNSIIRIEETTGNIKPIIFLPILNLQKDINKHNYNGIDNRLEIIGSKLKFISGVYIKISNKEEVNSPMMNI